MTTIYQHDKYAFVTTVLTKDAFICTKVLPIVYLHYETY